MGEAPFSVAIAGGGIGGMATALALARRGIRSEVCERRPEFPEEGAGIQIGPNGTRILRDLGVADFLQNHVAEPVSLSVRDGATGRELTRLPLGEWIAKRHGAPYWTAHRRDLHVALRTRAEGEPLITLRPGVEVLSFTSERDSISAVCANGEVLKASLLVAADGLWSTLRNDLSIKPARRAPLAPVGKTAFRAVVKAGQLPEELDANAVHIWLAPSAHAVHYPVSGGREIALVVIAGDHAHSAEWDAAATPDAAAENVQSFAAPLRALVGAAHDWRRWSLYRMPPLDRWTFGRAALLGDAAHPIMPYLAQGAVLALEGAVTLAAHIARGRDDVEKSLQDYEGDRRARVRRVAEASERNGRIYHMSGALTLARDMALRGLSPAYVMSGFDWLYGWRPPAC
jgi:salicylate hydroxylase